MRRGTAVSRQLAVGRPHRPSDSRRLEGGRVAGGGSDARRQLNVVEDVVERVTAPSTSDVAAPLSADVFEHRLNRVAVRVACTRVTHLAASSGPLPSFTTTFPITLSFVHRDIRREKASPK